MAGAALGAVKFRQKSARGKRRSTLFRGLWQISDVKSLLPPARGYFAIGVEGISNALKSC
jgi:hypothetical protein